MLRVICLLMLASLTAGQIYVPQQIAYQLGVQTTPSVFIMVDTPSNYAGTGYTQIIALQASNLVLECQVYNMPSTAIVKWYIRTYVLNAHGVPTLTQSSAISTGYSSLDPSRWKIGPGTQTNAFRLEIDSISYQDEGSYECDVLYTTDSVAITERLMVYVYSVPQMLPTYCSPQTQAKIGDKVTLTCNSTGRPAPYIRWQRVGGSSALIPSWGRLKEGTSLTLNSVQPGDRGIYQCTAENLVGSDSWAVQFTVSFQPIVTLPSQPVAQAAGYNKQITCSVQGNSIPSSAQVQWTRNGVQVTTGGNKRVDYNQGADFTVYYTLRFLPVLASDFDTYTCIASNEWGISQSSVQLVSSSTPTPTGTGAAQLASHVRASAVLTCAAILFALVAVVRR